MLIFSGTGPGFGLPSSKLIRKKLLTVLSESGKTASLIDNISVVKRYASESSNSIPVFSDDEALSKARKEVVYPFYVDLSIHDLLALFYIYNWHFTYLLSVN